MTAVRSAATPDAACLEKTWPYLPTSRIRQEARVGSRSEKVRLRRKPVRKSSRFVCEVILDAFEKALETESFEACTTNRIADIAGVGIGSFYEYFSNKETVLAVWLNRHSAFLLAEFDRLIEKGPGFSLHDQVEAIVRGVFHCYARKPRLWARIAHVVYAISTDEQCQRCAREFTDRWERLLSIHYCETPGGHGLLSSTAQACHALLLARIESATPVNSATLDGPHLQQGSFEALMHTIQETLGSTVR